MLLTLAGALCATVGCGGKAAKKENRDFFTSGSREADQRASQRMAKDEQLTGSGEGATFHWSGNNKIGYNVLSGEYTVSGEEYTSTQLVQTTNNGLRTEQNSEVDWTIQNETGNSITGSYSGTKTGTVTSDICKSYGLVQVFSQDDTAGTTVDYSGNRVTGESTQTVTSTLGR